MGRLSSICGSSHQLKKNVVKVGHPLKKLSGSAHGVFFNGSLFCVAILNVYVFSLADEENAALLYFN